MKKLILASLTCIALSANAHVLSSSVPIMPDKSTLGPNETATFNLEQALDGRTAGNYIVHCTIVPPTDYDGKDPIAILAAGTYSDSRSAAQIHPFFQLGNFSQQDRYQGNLMPGNNNFVASAMFYDSSDKSGVNGLQISNGEFAGKDARTITLSNCTIGLVY